MAKYFKDDKRFYTVWRDMKQRCADSNFAAYYRYGGRGIKVCERWLKYVNFRIDMFPTYKDNLTLDRIDNNGEYSKENCRWATRKEQANNTRRNHFFEYMGIADTITNWANFFGIKKSTLDMRIIYGWSFEKAIHTPVQRRSK